MGVSLRTGVPLAVCIAAFLWTGTAGAETYTVATTADNVGESSEGHSLRSAIRAANANPGPDTIVVPSGLYILTTGGANEDGALSGDLDVTDDVTISGTPLLTTVDGNALDRVFQIHMPNPLVHPQVTLEGLRITGGRVVPAGSLDGGGGVKNDGALTVTDSAIDANIVDGAGFAPAGGGLLTSGPLTIEDSTLSGNTSRNSEGDAVGGGLAVFANGVIDVALTRVSVNGNVVRGNQCGPGRGGGLYLSNATNTTITDSQIGAREAGNEAHELCGDGEQDEGEGGGIYNATSGGDESPSRLVLVDTLVQWNVATFGGGIYNAGPISITEGSSVEHNGAVRTNGESPKGGGIYNRAGRDDGLYLFDSFVRDNTVDADHPDAEAQGGGIHNANGYVELTDVEVTGNVASSQSGDSDGGGIMSDTFGCQSECGEPGRILLTRTLVQGNSAGDGGGVRLRGGGDVPYEQGRFDESVIAENGAGRGGGLYVRGKPGSTSTAFSRSTVRDNTAGFRGAGVYAAEEDLDLDATTISGNAVVGEAFDGQMGGGLFLLGSEGSDDPPGATEVERSTVSGNSAPLGGGIAGVGGEGGPAPALTLRETTFEGNVAESGGALHNAGEATAFGTIFAGEGSSLCAGTLPASQGYNLDESEGTCGLDRETDLVGVDPLLGALADNGGPTQTHLPQDGSPAIDHVPDCAGTDQRGVARPQGSRCDIGSVEVEQDDGGGGPANFVVDDDRAQCPSAAFTTIQSAVDAAPDGTTITVCAGLYAEQVAVHNVVTLQGPGGDPTAGCSGWGPADPTRDAIVDGDGIGLSLQVSSIAVDGLVVRGNTTGIETSAEFSGHAIRDNVVVGNTFGVELASAGETPAAVERNCVRDNTRAGIYGLNLTDASIDDNAFVVPDQGGAESWGLFLGQIECCPASAAVFDVSVTNNQATGPGSGNTRFAELSRTSGVVVSGNVATGFASANVFLANGNAGTQVSGNQFTNGGTGIWISQIAFVGGATNTGATISGNTISAMVGYGVGIESGRSLNASTISNNAITAAGLDGIGFQGGANDGNTISGNTLSGSDEHDCHDDTTGSGTAGTGNTWVDNTGSTSQPPGLCGQGTLSVSDASANEGDTLTFTVTLDRSSSAVTVAYATRNGTATAGSDYTSTSGTLTFGPGELSKTVTVPTTEDAADEPDETVLVDLSSPSGATIADGEGLGTIRDDDEAAPTPAISISDASVAEGNAGTTELTFTLARTPATGESRVSFATANGTATAGSDYNATSGTVVFGAGEGEKTVVVEVIGDLAVESDETLLVNLTSPVNATISDSQGQGTIGNDDVAVVPAELALTKTDSPDPVTVGRDLTYTVTVANSGQGAAQNVVVTDTLPAGVFFTFASSSQGTCTFVAPQVVCTVGTVGAPGTVVITIVVQPITPGTLTNSATVTTSTPEGNTTNNTAQTTTTVNAAPPPSPQPQAKLDVIKTDSVDPVAVGQKIEYLITVDNDGDGDAVNVRLDDSLTDGVQFVSAAPSQGTCSNAGSNVQCQLGTIAAGASAEVTLVVRALRSGTVTNTARATTTSPANEDLNSDFEQTTVTPAAGDLAIEKHVFTPLERAAKGEQRTEEDRAGAGAVGLDMTYVLTAANDGPSPVANVTVEDQLPANLALKAVRTTRGACTVGPKQTLVRCALGALDSGEAASITIIVRPAKAGRYTNVATIAGDAPDPVPANNRARVETVVVASLPRIPVFRPACQFSGTDAANQFRGGPRNEVFCGYGGRDDIDAGRGNDVVFGGFGDDIVRVDLGLDFLDGEEGDDRIHAADGKVDVVIGGIGIDYVIVDRFDFVVGAEYVCIQNARRNCT